jgi:hypothetical protein
MVRLYRKIVPGAEQDEEIAPVWQQLCQNLDMADQTIKTLQTPGLTRSERLPLLDANSAAAALVDAQEFSRIRKEAHLALCKALKDNPAAGLADLPSFFKSPMTSTGVYRMLAPGAERDEEIAVEWAKLRQIITIASDSVSRKEALAIYSAFKQKEASGEDWESLIKPLMLSKIEGGDYEDLISGSPPLELEDFDDELMIDGIRLHKRDEE